MHRSMDYYPIPTTCDRCHKTYRTAVVDADRKHGKLTTLCWKCASDDHAKELKEQLNG